MSDERAEHAVRLVESLKAHYGAPFEELVALLERSDDLISELIEKAATALPEEEEQAQAAALDLLRFLADGYAGRAGFQSGVAVINFGVNPTSVFHSMQQAQHLGLEEAVTGHRKGCEDPTCRAPVPLEKFLHGLRHMMMRVRHEAEAHASHLDEVPPLKH